MSQSYISLLIAVCMFSMQGEIDVFETPPEKKIIVDNGDDMVIIPFKRANNLILIEASIDTLSGNFVLDTGAPGLILNKTYFRESWSSNTFEATNATGSSSAVSKTIVRDFNINELHFSKINAEITELSHIENKRGVKILGLLGVNLFKDYEL